MRASPPSLLRSMSKAGRLWEPYGGAELLSCHLQNAKAACRSVLDKPHRASSSCARKDSLPADRSLSRAGDIVIPACNVSYMSVPYLALNNTTFVFGAVLLPQA